MTKNTMSKNVAGNVDEQSWTDRERSTPSQIRCESMRQVGSPHAKL
jgi:hypothetical protein